MKVITVHFFWLCLSRLWGTIFCFTVLINTALSLALCSLSFSGQYVVRSIPFSRPQDKVNNRIYTGLVLRFHHSFTHTHAQTDTQKHTHTPSYTQPHTHPWHLCPTVIESSEGKSGGAGCGGSHQRARPAATPPTLDSGFKPRRRHTPGQNAGICGFLYLYRL